MILYICFILPFLILVYFFGRLVYSIYYDYKNPPEPIHYVWRYVYPNYKGEWDRGNTTSVYIDPKTNNIRGKVVKQSDGLYRATMWNEQYKEFIDEHEAIKAVEEYKPRVYK